MRGGAPTTDVVASYDRNQEATLYVGNLAPRVDEDVLWELFTQAGPVRTVHMPRDSITGNHQGFGFVELNFELDADYALKILSTVKLYGRLIRIHKAAQDKRQNEIGANLFIGNLNANVDDRILFETFSSFGNVISAKVSRDPETGVPKGFGFVSYDGFDASDLAIESMNQQYLCNNSVSVSYAYKKDTKGERHGSAAERMLATSKPKES